MPLVILLLIAILITLLGAWGIVGWLVLIAVVIAVLASMYFGISEFIREEISDSPVVNYVVNTKRIKKLNSEIERRSKLGYESPELEKELEMRRSNRFRKYNTTGEHNN